MSTVSVKQVQWPVSTSNTLKSISYWFRMVSATPGDTICVWQEHFSLTAPDFHQGGEKGRTNGCEWA